MTLMHFVTIAALSLAGAAGAADRPYAIRDTSFRDPLSGRVQQLTLDVAAPAERVWAALTTDEGLKSWVAPVAHVDLMNGGIEEASYDPRARLGDRENIRNQIIAYVPGRLLVYHNIHVPKGAPPDFALLAALRTVIEIEAIDAGHSRVIESGVGYGEGPSFDALYGHFSGGNREEFELLAQAVTGHPVDWVAGKAKSEASTDATPQSP